MEAARVLQSFPRSRWFIQICTGRFVLVAKQPAPPPFKKKQLKLCAWYFAPTYKIFIPNNKIFSWICIYARMNVI